MEDEIKSMTEADVMVERMEDVMTAVTSIDRPTGVVVLAAMFMPGALTTEGHNGAKAAVDLAFATAEAFLDRAKATLAVG